MPTAPPPTLIEKASLFLQDIGLLSGRLLTAWCLVIFHAWGEFLAGYRHFFGPKEPWGLPQILANVGIPLALASAVAFTLAMWSVALCLATGLLTRVAALLLIVLCATVAFVSPLDVWQEVAGAYAAAGLLLLFCGPGRFSLDALVQLHRQPPKPKGVKYTLGNDL